MQNLKVEFSGYEGTARVLDVDHLSVHRGEVFGLAGESGSGKTVLALAVLRLIPSPPGRISSGRLLFRGRDILTLRAPELQQIRGRRIALIFQDPMSSLNPVFTVGQQLTRVIRQHHRMTPRQAHSLAAEKLAQVRLPDPERTLSKYPHELSGGMRQRVVIAMALSCGAELLIADEATRALDVTVQAGILDLLRDLKRETGLTILFIANNMGVVSEMCDRVGILYAGELVETGPVDQVFGEPLHPYTGALLAAVPRVGSAGEPLPVISGFAPHPLHRPPGCSFQPRCPRALPICARERPPRVGVDPAREITCHLYAGSGT